MQYNHCKFIQAICFLCVYRKLVRNGGHGRHLRDAGDRVYGKYKIAMVIEVSLVGRRISRARISEEANVHVEM